MNLYYLRCLNCQEVYQNLIKRNQNVMKTGSIGFRVMILSFSNSPWLLQVLSVSVWVPQGSLHIGRYIGCSVCLSENVWCPDGILSWMCTCLVVNVTGKTSRLNASLSRYWKLLNDSLLYIFLFFFSKKKGGGVYFVGLVITEETKGRLILWCHKAKGQCDHENKQKFNCNWQTYISSDRQYR